MNPATELNRARFSRMWKKQWAGISKKKSHTHPPIRTQSFTSICLFAWITSNPRTCSLSSKYKTTPSKKSDKFGPRAFAVSSNAIDVQEGTRTKISGIYLISPPVWITLLKRIVVGFHEGSYPTDVMPLPWICNIFHYLWLITVTFSHNIYIYAYVCAYVFTLYTIGFGELNLPLFVTGGHLLSALISADLHETLATRRLARFLIMHQVSCAGRVRCKRKHKKGARIRNKKLNWPILLLHLVEKKNTV